MRIMTSSVFISYLLRSGAAAFSTARAASFLARAPISKNQRLFGRATATTVALAVTANFTTMTSTYCDDDTTIVMPFDQDMLHHDHYRGITLKVDELAPDQSMDPSIFQRDLQDALEIWKAEGRKGIWIQIPTVYAHLIPSCISLGFDFHLAKPGQVTLCKWLPESPSRLPNGPTHQIGIGALVLDENKMLVVQEKTGPAAAKKLWKMPTGLADPGEDVADAAVRELKEETGLDATFEGIVCFRQAHTESGASDLFFVCLLKLNSDKEQSHRPCADEIADIAWMPVEEYANQDAWQNSPLYKELNDAMMRAARHEKHQFVEAKLPVGFRPGTNSLYKSGL